MPCVAIGVRKKTVCNDRDIINPVGLTTDVTHFVSRFTIGCLHRRNVGAKRLV